MTIDPSRWARAAALALASAVCAPAAAAQAADDPGPTAAAGLEPVLAERFAGWRIGIVTSEQSLARATGLPLEAGPYVAHGGLKVRLYQSGPLASK